LNGLINLTELSIESNEIIEIISGTFENMNNQTYLGFYVNRLEHLGSAVCLQWVA
jgi:Leucine-rich repeat (LRR) protein